MNTLLTGIGLATLALATAGTAHADDYCREYQRRITIGGKLHDSYGTACLQPDGSWKTVTEDEPRVVGRVTQEPVYEEPQPVIVYEEEPIYVPYRTTYRRYDPSPLWWGVNLSFNEHDGWRRHKWDRDERHGWRNRGHGHRGHDGHMRDRHKKAALKGPLSSW